MPVAALAEMPVAAEDPHRWEFSLSIPIWIPAVDGDVTVRGRAISVDQDTSDVVDLFDSHLNGAFALHFEAERDRFGMLVDLMWVDLEARGTRGKTDATANLEGFIGELGAFYTIVAPAKKRGWGAFRLDALGGVRVSSLEFGINGNTFDASVHRTIYDPYIGLRLELGLTEWLSLKARGDVGGFGIEAWPTSDLSYNVDAGLEFHLAEWCDLGLGYRFLTYEFDGNAHDSKFDATLSGPVVTLKFNF
jgi:opacity protein-like surface antigen